MIYGLNLVQMKGLQSFTYMYNVDTGYRLQWMKLNIFKCYILCTAMEKIKKKVFIRTSWRAKYSMLHIVPATKLKYIFVVVYKE